VQIRCFRRLRSFILRQRVSLLSHFNHPQNRRRMLFTTLFRSCFHALNAATMHLPIQSYRLSLIHLLMVPEPHAFNILLPHLEHSSSTVLSQQLCCSFHRNTFSRHPRGGNCRGAFPCKPRARRRCSRLPNYQLQNWRWTSWYVFDMIYQWAIFVSKKQKKGFNSILSLFVSNMN
jgi:hypothetical protein